MDNNNLCSGKLQVKGVHHIAISVSDLARSIAFYSQTLGMELLARPAMTTEGAWLQAGAVQLHLIRATPEDTVGKPALLNGRNNHIAFAIDNYSGMLESLKDEGVELIEGTAGIVQMFIRDPDNHIVEFIEA